MWRIANQSARPGTAVDFQIICLNKGEGAAPNLVKMAEGGDFTVPQLKRHFIVVCRCGSEVHQVCCGQAEFIPQGNRGVACQMHGACMSEECAVKMLGMSVLGGSIGCSVLVIDAVHVTPARSQSGYQFPIVSDKDL